MVKETLPHAVARIQEGCRRANREERDILIVYVTKKVTPERIREVYECGVRDFGENRIQELLEKKERLPKDIRWHFIGHIQTNKVKAIVGEVELIHSCDRIELAQAIQKQAEKKNQKVEVLVQVNVSGEETKHGFSPDRVLSGIKEIAAFDRIVIRGLMAMAPFCDDQEVIRRTFRSLRNLSEQLREKYPQLDWHFLSMGMSADFELAIEEGSNCVRIGTAVFGERPRKE